MGTKRTLAPVVREAVDGLQPNGPVVDLFSGMGSVAYALAPKHSVTTNDLLSFTTVFARTRFTATRKPNRDDLLRQLVGRFERHHRRLGASYGWRVAREKRALAGGRAGLAAWFDEAPHVGNSAHYYREATDASSARTSRRYRLTTLYFATGYFSTAQAIEVDALRYAIDMARLAPDVRDWALAAWLVAGGRLVSAPGHTAQFLRPTSDPGFERIHRTWQRRVWPLFVAALGDLGPLGNAGWRRRNSVLNYEALDLLGRLDAGEVGAVYADPPYTKDQYSRYYHLYETLYRYDFPDSKGRARARSDRFSTGFSLASGVEDALDALVRLTAELDRPLVLSYPADGLLATRDITVDEVIRRHRKVTRMIEIAYKHSTMGASQGSKHKDTTERIYVCR
jgi:adenine-specific DNA-methyltransferase